MYCQKGLVFMQEKESPKKKNFAVLLQHYRSKTLNLGNISIPVTKEVYLWWGGDHSVE